MNITEWLEVNLPKIEERMKIKVQATRATKVMTDGSNLCSYRVDRSAENLSPANCCFFGWLIAPEEYDADNMESRNAADVADELSWIDWRGEEYSDDRQHEFNCLNELQMIHDSRDPEEWDNAYIQWKEDFNSLLPDKYRVV